MIKYVDKIKRNHGIYLTIPETDYKNNQILLEKLLTLGYFENEFIDVTNVRSIGKTEALIKFAKKKGIAVLVGLPCSHEKSKYDYEKIYSINGGSIRAIKEAVIDETVSLDQVPQHIKVITGFYNSDINE
ncbi:hypothetical protein [Paenibacillus sp. QZ-Y1]|uniref:hypothetical protein n=1 Tax=Paenibacillus sp. QZ-Y1 TaxID=3414511 RepID=UPI003F7B1C55